MKHNKNIVIVNTFGIGDVLFSTPLVDAIKKIMPDAEVNYICNQRTYKVLENNKNINNIVVFEKDHFRDVAKKSKIRFLKKFIGLCKKIKSLNADAMIGNTKKDRL